MSGNEPFSVGDQVECVDAGPSQWTGEPSHLVAGRVYRVVEVIFARWGGYRFMADGEFGLAIDGPMPPLMHWQRPGTKTGWRLDRFRAVAP